MYPTTDDLQDILREDQRQLEEALAEIRKRAERGSRSGDQAESDRTQNGSQLKALSPSSEAIP